MRNILTLEGLGEHNCWVLIRQALGMPDSKMISDFMEGKVALLLFTRQSLPERLCVTAAVRQMSGSTIYQGDTGPAWKTEINDFQEQLLAIFGHYIDCLYLYGFAANRLEKMVSDLRFPVVNAGSPDSHPAHALADIACMIRVAKNLQGQKAAWIGCGNGTLISIMEATKWFPFSLNISMPPQMDDAIFRAKAIKLGTDIKFFSSPAEAVKNANFIYAGWRGDMSREELAQWEITASLMEKAAPGARVLLSASPIRAIFLEESVLNKLSPMLIRQAEYRLRIHKRMLHWLFEKQQGN